MSNEQLSVRDKYLEQMVESASPEGLLILMVEGAVNFIRRAKFALEKDNFDDVNNNLLKTQNIYLELTLHLDIDAGEFAESLALVYQYLYNLLIEANIDKDEGKINTCLRLAEDIRDLWKETIEKAKSEAVDVKPGAQDKDSVVADPETVGKTGVYDTAIAEKKPDVEDTSPRLNITG